MSNEIDSTPKEIIKQEELTTSKVRMPIVKAAKDVLTGELMKPVGSRMRKRYKQILEMSRAKTTSIMRGLQKIHTTEGPDMHISGLRLTTKNGVGTITYHRYKTDAKGNKLYEATMKKVRNTAGDMVDVEVGGMYKHECLVVETIEYMKPIKVEEIKEFVQ